jgi:VanZ family protein
MGAYIALQPEYNTAHWTPNQTMRKLGMPYRYILAYEHYLPWALHFFIGLILTLLLFFSKFYYRKDQYKRVILGFFLMVGVILINEWAQSLIGRNVQISDLIFGLAGISIATVYLAKIYLMSLNRGYKIPRI